MSAGHLLDVMQFSRLLLFLSRTGSCLCLLVLEYGQALRLRCVHVCFLANVNFEDPVVQDFQLCDGYHKHTTAQKSVAIAGHRHCVRI